MMSYYLHQAITLQFSFLNVYIPQNVSVNAPYTKHCFKQPARELIELIL